MKSLYIQRNLPRTTVQYIWCPQNRTHPFTKKIPKNVAISHNILACLIAPVLKLPISFPRSRENEM